MFEQRVRITRCYLLTRHKFINGNGHSQHQMTLSALAQEQVTCRPEVCSLIRGIKRAGSPWNLIVAAYLLDGPRRFNQILQMGKDDSLNSRTLSRALKQLVGAGFAERRILDTQPFAVAYSLTPHGEGLRKLLQAYEDLDSRVKA